jgi:hypothetical protein
VARHHTAFRERHLQPLGHLSTGEFSKFSAHYARTNSPDPLRNGRTLADLCDVWKWKSGRAVEPRRFDFGTPGRIRTCGLWVRNPTLYPLSYRRARHSTIRANSLSGNSRTSASGGKGGIRTLGGGLKTPQSLSRRSHSTTLAPSRGHRNMITGIGSNRRRGRDSNPRSFRSTVFKTAALNRSATSPCGRYSEGQRKSRILNNGRRL